MYCHVRSLFCIAFSFLLALFAVACTSRVSHAGPQFTIYDVNFDGPPHVVGATPTFGAGPFPRITPTSGGQIFPSGSAKVVAANGLLTQRPVKLTTIDQTPGDPFLGGVDLLFDMTDPQLASLKRFHASVDVLANDISASTGMGIFFDAPSIHAVEFAPDGTIRIRDPFGLDKVVGQHFGETVYHVGMTFDRTAAEWSVAINGTPVYQGPIESPDLERFRISMTTGNTMFGSTATLDNINIWADVPEPATIATLGFALFGGGLLARRRPTRSR
jgi:hypothetical protein